MATYAFASFQGAISGVGGSFNIGFGAGISDGGISTTMAEDKNNATTGADGTVMHALRAGNLGRITIRCLKTSTLNARLSYMYNLQKQTPAAWGQNVVSGADVIRGDNFVLAQAAFVKFPDNTWDKDGKDIEWELTGNLEEQIGAGTPDVNL